MEAGSLGIVFAGNSGNRGMWRWKKVKAKENEEVVWTRRGEIILMAKKFKGREKE